MIRAALLAGAAVAVQRWRSHGVRMDAADPCGPLGLHEPEGEERVVVTDDGARLAVRVAGPLDGPTVVLAHCWTGNRTFWAPVARRLVLGGHRVVLYDHRGHARSSAGDLAPSIDVLGHDLHAVMRAVDVRDAVLVGHSMGGMTAQAYAALHTDDFAARVRGVVLVATSARLGLPQVPGALLERVLADGRRWTSEGRVGRLTVRRSIGRVVRQAHLEATLDGWTTSTAASRAGFLAAMLAMDLREGLGDIAVPVTVMVGSHDVLTPPRMARQLARAIPGARLVVLPGAGHMLPLEDPDRIVDEVRRAVAAEPAPDRRLQSTG